MTGWAVRPEDKSRAAGYYLARSAGYRRPVEWVLNYLRRRECHAILRFANLADPGIKTVIDIGCGDGCYALAAKAAGLWVSAVDISPAVVAGVRGRVDEARVADIEALDAWRTFDVVVCSGVLEFVVDPEQAFRNLRELMSPGGRLVVQVPRRGLGGAWYRLEKAAHRIRVHLFSREWLARVAADAGLALLDVAYPLPHNIVALLKG